jgi:MFS family permease
MRLTPEEFKVSAITGIAHALVHAAMLVFPAVLEPMRADLGVSVFAVSIIGNVSYLSFGLLAFPSGLLADRIGSRRVMAFSTGGIALGAAGTAAAAYFTRDIYAVGAFMGVLGLAAALYHPAGLSLVGKRFGAVEKGMAYHGIWGMFGLAGGPLLAGTITRVSSYHLAYAAIAVLAVCLAPLPLLMLKQSQDKDIRRDEADAESDGRSRLPGLIVIFIVVGIIGLAFNGATSFLPTRLSVIDGLFTANLITTAALLVGIVGQYAGAFLAMKLRKEILLSAAMALTGFMLIGLGGTSGLWLVPAALLFGLFHFTTQPLTNSLISRLAPGGRKGLAFGISFTINFGVGSFGTGLAGFLADNVSLAYAFIILGLISFVGVPLALVIVLLGKRKRPAPRRPVETYREI